MQKFSCCKIVRTCVMDSFRGSHRPNFLYDQTTHLGISRIQNCICTTTYINVMTKFIFKLSFVFFSIYKSITFLFSTVWYEKKNYYSFRIIFWTGNCLYCLNFFVYCQIFFWFIIASVPSKVPRWYIS